MQCSVSICNCCDGHDVRDLDRSLNWRSFCLVNQWHVKGKCEHSKIIIWFLKNSLHKQAFICFVFLFCFFGCFFFFPSPEEAARMCCNGFTVLCYLIILVPLFRCRILLAYFKTTLQFFKTWISKYSRVNPVWVWCPSKHSYRNGHKWSLSCCSLDNIYALICKANRLPFFCSSFFFLNTHNDGTYSMCTGLKLWMKWYNMYNIYIKQFI